MEIINRKFLLTASFVYLALPTILFLGGWVIPWVGIPLILAVIFAVYYVIDVVGKGNEGIRFDCKKGLVILGIVGVWVCLSGIGGYIWQNRWDHMFRNAVFLDLVRYEWPVVVNNEMLTYYLGFWLVPSSLAKLTGSLELGWFFQFVWGVTGLYLALLWIYEFIGAFKIRVIFIVLLVGTIDIIPFFFYKGDWNIDTVIENWNPIAFLEWPDTMIYWVYNQMIPSFMACMMIYVLKSARVTVLVIAFLLLLSPMSIVLLVPLAVVQLLIEVVKNSKWNERLKTLLAPSNIISLLVAIVIGTYLLRNRASGIRHFVTFNSLDDLWNYLVDIVVLLSFAIIVWLPFIFKYIRCNLTFWVLMLCYFPCFFFVMGTDTDFLSRTSQPLTSFILLYLSLFVCRDWRKSSKYVKGVFVSLVCLSGLSVASEIYRIGYYTFTCPMGEYREFKAKSVYDLEFLQENFIGNPERWPFIKNYSEVKEEYKGEDPSSDHQN